MQIKLFYFILNVTFSKKKFFSSTITELNELESNLRSAASLSVFQENLLKFIRPSSNSIFNWHNCKGIKYLPRLSLGLCYLREHIFKYGFQDTLNPFRLYSLDVETNTHFLSLLPLV